MARKLIVELIADPRGYTAGLQTAAKQTKVFGAEMDKATRGILSGSGALHGLGRSLAFASGGFLAFEGASKFLQDSVSAARDAGVAQRSLAAQMTASGESFTASKAAVDKASLSLEKFGFTSEDSQHALTVLERGTGSITRAIQLQGVAANLARAKNIDLASAANILAKVFGGQTTALRRAVPGLDKHAQGLQLIYEAEAKLAGQARAGTTESERFAATLHNTEVIVGTALLPTLNKFLESLGKWLDKMNRSGQLQKDVNEAVKTGTALFQAALDIVKPLAAGFKALGDAVGGTKNEVELLLGAFLAFKGSKLLEGLGLIGSKAETSKGDVDALRGSLMRLGAIGAIGIELDIAIRAKTDKWLAAIPKDIGNAAGNPSGTNILSTLIGRPGDAGFLGNAIWGALGVKSAGPSVSNTFPWSAAGGKAGGKAGGPDRLSIPKGGGGSYFVAAPPLTAMQNLRTGLAGDPNNVGLLRQLAAHDTAALAFAKKLRTSGRITNQQYVTEVTGYASELQQTNTTIAGILQAAAQKTKDAAAAAAQKIKDAAATAAKSRADAQQALFDRLQFNVDKAGLTSTLSDDLNALQKYQAVLRSIIATQGSTLALQQQLLAVEMNIKSVQGQIDSNRLQAAQAAKQAANQAHQKVLQAAQKAAQDAAARRDLIQFRLLGLGPSGGALVPGAANLQRRLSGVRDAVKGTFLDTAKTGGELDHIGRILAGKFGKVSESVRAAIDQMYKDIRDKLKGHQGDQTRFRHLSAAGFVDSLGLNLTLAQRRAIEARFTTVGAHGTVPGGQSHQFGGVTITGPVHIHGVQDIAGLENEIAKRAKARPHTPEGRLMADPAGRFLIAFDDPTLEPDPTWTRIDSHPHLVTSYTIDRGRQYELDRTDTGRATVQIADPDGILDPTNPFGPFWDTTAHASKIRPLLQATLGRYNPVTDTWYTRYRGFIEEMDYTFDPSQRFNRLQLTLIDIFEILSAVEMLPDGSWGDTPPAGSEGQVFFDNAVMGARITQVLTNAGIPTAFYVVFSGNVNLYESTYSPAESAMTAVQEAADAEFPGVSNVFTDRFGRLACHGRLAKFDPAGVLAGASPGAWDWHHWQAGDGAAVNASPSDTAHLRQFAFNRGLSKIINSTLATPVGIADTDVAGQKVADSTSIGLYGIRSWSAQNLITEHGLLPAGTGTTALAETKLFAQYYVDNYRAPLNRVTVCGFRTMSPAETGAAATWALLSQVDISDRVDITVASPGGGGFLLEPYYVEGVHESVQPLGEVYDDVTLTLDLSPKAFYDTNPFPT